MPQNNVLKGLQIAKDIPYRDPDALFALAGTDGMGKSAYLPVGGSMLERHLLLLGSAATGKTNMLLHLARNLRAHLTDEDAMVVFDPSGEYYRALYQKGDVVLSDDERASGARGETAWNLFHELTDGDCVLQDASALCDLLFRERIQAAARPFETMAARDLLMALIAYLKKQGDGELCNHLALRELIEDFDVESMCEILHSEPELRAYAVYLSDPESERTQGVVAALQQAARELFAGRFGMEDGIGMRPLLRSRGGRVIFLCYEPTRGTQARSVYAALCDLCLQEALSPREPNGTVCVLLDDAGLLPAMPHLEDALVLGRAKGLRVMLSTIGIGALQARYGAAADTLLNAIGTTVCFRLQDRPTREYVKSLYGRHRVVESYRSTVQRGIVEQVVDEYVVGDEDLTALQPGESIIATMHYPPFRFRLKPYGADQPIS